MRVRVLLFGVLKEWLGSSSAALELSEGATVADLLQAMCDFSGWDAANLRGIAVSVNAEYASRKQVLQEGDEVGLLPPVSGGSEGDGALTVLLTYEPIDAAALVAAAKGAEDGGVVVFDGIVRNNSRGRSTLYLDYEAYEEMARRQMEQLALRARQRFGARSIVVAHRLGRLQIGETSVLIVVASAHRAEAFDACRWLIDTLKGTVPIWKRETFADGVVWAAGEPFPSETTMESAEAEGGK